MKRLPTYRPETAHYAYRLGALAVAVFLITVAGYRFRFIDETILVLAAGGAGLLALSAVLLSGVSLWRLWRRGGEGSLAAFWGGLAGILVLAPFVWLGAGLRIAPSLPDISTDLVTPPEIRTSSLPGAMLPEPVWTAPIEADPVSRIQRLSLKDAPDTKEAQAEFYPDIVPRRYRVPPARLHAAALVMAAENAWPVAYELPPDLLDEATALQLLVRDPVIGMEQTLALRIRQDPVGTLLDIRSVSPFALPGLSSNAERVRDVFDELDRVLLDTYGDLARIVVQEEEAGLIGADEINDDASGGSVPVTPVPQFKPFFEIGEGGPEGPE
ncbi:DUF1499 domain-containing protein [Roseibium sp. RKSG952]|uniref:DUF1499 domain-containing protein n=1 Tax=Roseibium sp. RKSG952 TaxID=2529384 RepID=UPI0012BB5D2A|nr:DUF1499 domain-containing protein [Roseibium sp. RKSG952]MTH96514.1 DUF1499 domain-containing protein [Roseibium sp. RKSG952]